MEIFETVEEYSDHPANCAWNADSEISENKSFAFGIFILALSARFVSASEIPVIEAFVENAMEVMIGIMPLVFGAVLSVTGINFPAMRKGLLIPKLPFGLDGILC